MRRFFGTHRAEDFSQIQYLTAKCHRLSHEKAALERECLVARERERALQNDLEALSLQLCQKERIYVELTEEYDQVLNRLKHEQGMVKLLQQRMVSVAEGSSKDAVLLGLHLEQVSSDLQLLQDSEVQLVGLVDELHQEVQYKAQHIESLEAHLREETQCRTQQIESLEAELCAEAHRNAKQLESLEMQLCEEAQRRAKLVEELETQLHKEAQHKDQDKENLEQQLQSKNCELMKLQNSYDAVTQELEELRGMHERTVQRLRRENSGSLQKLREMAEQFEWLCEQQRIWMCCVKRFKDCLSDEKEALTLQVHRLQGELTELRKNSSTETPTTEDSPIQQHSALPSWDNDVMADLQAEVDRWRQLYEDLFSKLTTHQVSQDQWNEDGYLKPP